MEGRLQGDAVRVGGDARQRFHDSRGYGRPAEGDDVDLARIEAAHLLFRGDLDRVEGMDFREFFAASVTASDRFALRFLVYADLRERGFYLSPAREGWPGAAGRIGGATAAAYDVLVYPRGSGPGEGAVEYPVRVVGERESVPAASLLEGPLAGGPDAESGRGKGPDADADPDASADSGGAGAERSDDGPAVVLAVVDEESDLTYLEARRHRYDGGTDYDPPGDLRGVLLDDRVLCWDAPAELYERGFYGQPFSGRTVGEGVEGAIQLSLVEAASLAAEGALSIADDAAAGGNAGGATSGGTDGTASGGTADDAGDRGTNGERTVEAGAYDAVVARGRAVEGDRFDRRLRAYAALRAAGVVPKTGYKFGADFRTYATVGSVADLGHAETLVRVLSRDHAFAPRDLALDVRLAGGVRKRMVFALTGPTDRIDWLSVARLTP